MLIRNDYKTCHRLYWELEDFEKEAPLATFSFAGRTHFLEFDGCVDDLIWNALQDTRRKAVDVSELYEAVPVVEEADTLLRAGGKVKIQISGSRHWWATQHSGPQGECVVLRSELGPQTATITRDWSGGLKRLVLRTEAPGIIHEIKAQPGIHGQLEAVAEAVTVLRG